MKTKTTFLLLMNLFSITVFSQSWTNYTNDRLIYDVLVSGNNVWVGSQGGLTRTNMLTGEFETFLPSNSSIIGGGIEEIEKAPDNSLWMVSENAGILHLKNGEWTNYYDGIISSQYYKIKNLQVLPNGDVWFFTDYSGDEALNRLVRIRNGLVESFGNLPEDIKSFAVLDEHIIYISVGNKIHQYDATLQQITTSYHSGNSIISTGDEFREIILDKNGGLILGTESGILQLKDGNISVLSSQGVSVLKAFKDGVDNVYLATYTNEPNNIRVVKYNGITVSYFKDSDLQPYPAADDPVFRGADGEGRMYAVVWNVDTEFILFRFDNNNWTPVKTQIYPLLDNYQEDVQADCEGNLWFSSRDGVDVRYIDGTWKHFHVDVTPFTYFLPGHMTVDPVTCDVWFANISNSGSGTIPGIIRISNETISHFLYGHANVYDVEATGDGKVYFFSGNTGFGYIENDEVYYIDQMDELDFVTSIDSDSKGNIYLASWGSTVIKYDGVSLTHLGVGELTEYVYEVFVDNNDLLWVDYSGGTKLFDGVNWADYTDVWPANSLNDIVQDRKGNYWVSTWNDGLYYWDKQNLQHYTIFNSDLSTNLLRGVALDPVGNLIVTQHVGASILEIGDLTGSYRGSGTVFFDYEKDGAFDQGQDILVPGQKIRDTNHDLWAVTNSFGKYYFYSDLPETNNYLHELETDTESTTANPQSATFVDYNSSLPDFGFWKQGVPDVRVSIVNGIPVCNRDFRVHIFLRNKNLYAIEGDFTLTYNDMLTLVESSIPVSQQSAGHILFEDLSIPPLGSLDIKLDFTAPGLTAESTLLFFEGIFNALENSFTGITMDSVVCSYDPNDKKVEPTGEFIHDYSLIEDALKYTIRFQNEGTYKAFDITIMDTLDRHLDPATFELLGSSHNVETTITDDGIVTFVFPNIDLPARSDDELGSQGFVSFTVKPDIDIKTIEKIYNRAGIYFDFNSPIVTNMTEWNVVDDLTIVSTKEANADISIYPNPTKDMLYITIDNKSDYDIWNASGKHIEKGVLQPGSNTIQLNVPAGIYYLQVSDADAIYTPLKVVVIH